MQEKMCRPSKHCRRKEVGMAGGMLGQCHGFESFVSTPASSTKASQFEGAGARLKAISLVHSHSVKKFLGIEVHKAP